MVKDFLDSLPKDILDRTKNLDLNIKSSRCHEAIDYSLNKTVLNGGKRLRPLLTFLMGNLFNVDFDNLTPFARATELVHAASLSHDDVIDNATLRRGKPSINIVTSNKKAVLAGDYLLSKVIVDLCKTNEIEIVKEMSLVIKDLSEGEWLQLDLQHDRNYSRELIKEVALKKTSSVMSFCTVAPAILSRQSSVVINESRQFGINLGIAFQLIDDTLDFSSDSLKDSLLDLQNGVVNSVFFEYLNSNSDLLNRFKKGDDLISLVNVDDLNSSIETITILAHQYLELAHHNLEIIEANLNKNLDSKKVAESIEHLKLIISYLALRKS
jgi:geranylgeranyl pyrophosphate synthase